MKIQTIHSSYHLGVVIMSLGLILLSSDNLEDNFSNRLPGEKTTHSPKKVIKIK